MLVVHGQLACHLGFSLVVIQRVLNPREVIADRFLDLRECILDVAIIATALGDASLLAGDLQSLAEPVKALARLEERIRNKGLAVHAGRLRNSRQRKKRL